MKTLLLSLCLASSVMGQAYINNGTLSGAFASGGSAPVDEYAATNTPGYPVLAYYPARSYSGGVWADLSTNAWNLTNAAASVPATNTLDGKNIVSFDLNKWLRNPDWTNKIVNEIMMLSKFNWGNANEHRIFETADSAYLTRQNATTAYLYTRGMTDNKAVPTNSWMVWTFINPTTSLGYVFTNGAKFFIGSSGVSAAGSGLSIGGRYSDGATGSQMDIAEFIAWDTNLTDDVREAVYQTWRSTYPSAGLPAATYLLKETFENPSGYDRSDWTVTSDGGTTNPDNTTNVISGSESLAFVDSTAPFNGIYNTAAFQAVGSTNYLYFQFKIDTLPSAERNLVGWRMYTTSAGNIQFNASNRLQVKASGGTILATTLTLSAGTVYHVWLTRNGAVTPEYFELAVSTDGVKPTSGDGFISGTADDVNGSYDGLYFSTPPGSTIIDNILVDDIPIGNQ